MTWSRQGGRFGELHVSDFLNGRLGLRTGCGTVELLTYHVGLTRFPWGPVDQGVVGCLVNATL